MASRSLFRLTVTHLGGASANVASRIGQPPFRGLHVQAKDAATHFCKIRTRCTERRDQTTSPHPRSAFARPFSQTPRRSSPPGAGDHDQPAQPPPSAKRSPVRWATYAGLFALLATYALWDRDKERSARNLLNTERFTTCTVESIEPVSPAAFILTIRAPSTTNNDAVVREAWTHGLWSVEIKQPQLQIARNYTPLPPVAPPPPPPPRASSSSSGGGGKVEESLERGPVSPDAVTLRFFIRRYDGGEVSTYLSRLKRGDRVEIRGPHLGFDVGRRLGDAGRRVVFLAGGTGIASAMQAAAYLVEASDVSVQILWANRSLADCAGCPRVSVKQKGWFSRANEDTANEKHLTEKASPMVRQLRHLQAAYREKGHELDVECAVDEEGSLFQPRDIMGAVIRAGPLLGQVSSSPSCYFHSQGQLVHSTEEHDAVTMGKQGDDTSLVTGCSCEGGGGIGKNLFIISGPDGFVGAYVGPKVWAEGAERQGPVGGLVANLGSKDPTTWRDWLVLKQ